MNILPVVCACSRSLKWKRCEPCTCNLYISSDLAPVISDGRREIYNPLLYIPEKETLPEIHCLITVLQRSGIDMTWTSLLRCSSLWWAKITVIVYPRFATENVPECVFVSIYKIIASMINCSAIANKLNNIILMTIKNSCTPGFASITISSSQFLCFWKEKVKNMKVSSVFYPV
jgi:hypothetical protein